MAKPEIKNKVLALLREHPTAPISTIAEMAMASNCYVHLIAQNAGDNLALRKRPKKEKRLTAVVLKRQKRRALWEKGIGLCNTCGQEKPAEQMSKRTRKIESPSTTCKACACAAQIAYQKTRRGALVAELAGELSGKPLSVEEMAESKGKTVPAIIRELAFAAPADRFDALLAEWLKSQVKR